MCMHSVKFRFSILSNGFIHMNESKILWQCLNESALLSKSSLYYLQCFHCFPFPLIIIMASTNIHKWAFDEKSCYVTHVAPSRDMLQCRGLHCVGSRSENAWGTQYLYHTVCSIMCTILTHAGQAGSQTIRNASKWLCRWRSDRGRCQTSLTALLYTLPVFAAMGGQGKGAHQWFKWLQD